jgi:peptidyl-dipeptidase A
VTDAQPVNDDQLATRLSYFLWSSMPDDALFAAADDDALSEPDALEAQARRMFDDPKARDGILSFHRQWLDLDKVLSTNKDAATFPEWNDDLRRSIPDKHAAALLDDARQAFLKHPGVVESIAWKGVPWRWTLVFGTGQDAARALGYRDHFVFSLTLDELDETWLLALLDDLDGRLAATWSRTKDAIDEGQRERLGLPAGEDLQPWDYADAFFQDLPTASGDPLETALTHADPVEVARAYFHALGDDVDGVLERSDLYPRDGKNQHAFCADIDRRHDVRVLANCEPGTRWLGTMVHELGHAVYDLAIDSELPWMLRQPAHTFTTEAIAMLHGRLVRDETFLERFAGVAPAIARDPRHLELQRREMLVFASWVQVMTRFERELYRDPDQDLGALWWRLVARHQRIALPAGSRPDDWACKIHVALAPVYYQNYLLGEVTASQLAAALAREIGAPSPAVDPAAAGEILRERFMRPGSSMRWDALIAHATGEPLTVDHLAGWLTGA